jgi:hypothetical protein
MAVALALLVATVKGSLVACYFMHLISEKKLIYAVLVLTAVFFIVLLALPVSRTATATGFRMNLRWFHALLILLSAALAVLFGVWCLGQYRGRTGWQPARGHRGVRRVVRPGRLRLVVPAQDEDAAMTLRLASLAQGRARLRFVAADGLLIGGSSSVLACPMCFGAEETSMIDGTKLGVLVMLGITLAVQGAFAGFFLYLRKRAKRIAEVDLDTEWSELQRASRTS